MNLPECRIDLTNNILQWAFYFFFLLFSRKWRVWEVDDCEADEGHSPGRLQHRGTCDLPTDGVQEPCRFCTVTCAGYGKIATRTHPTGEQGERGSHSGLSRRGRPLLYPQRRHCQRDRLSLPRPHHLHLYGTLKRVLYHGLCSLVSRSYIFHEALGRTKER